MAQKKDDNLYDCVVIGAGPGGLVSAIYLARFNRKVALVDKGESRAQWIPRVRNLIAQPNGISGKQLLQRLRRQLKLYDAPIFHGEAQIHRLPKGFEVRTPKKTLRCQFVILATGMQDINPSLNNIEDLRTKKLLAYCPICDGYEYNNKRIGLIVRNNKGLRKAQFLQTYSKHLYIFKTRAFRTAPQHLNKINMLKLKIYDQAIEGLTASDHHTRLKIKLKNRKTEIKVDVAYIEMGTLLDTSATHFIRRLRRTRQGFIMTDEHQQTSVRGMYAVGDCVNGLSQISVAVGHAAIAATRIHSLID